MNIIDIIRILMDVIDLRDRAMNGENVDLSYRKDMNIFCLRAKM